jgi:hypothetical protein
MKGFDMQNSFPQFELHRRQRRSTHITLAPQCLGWEVLAQEDFPNAAGSFNAVTCDRANIASVIPLRSTAGGPQTPAEPVGDLIDIHLSLK